MIDFYKVLFVECDSTKDDLCWGEMTLRLETTETKKSGVKFLKKLGWTVDDPVCSCPYCSKKITKEEAIKKLDRHNLNLVKN